MSYNSNSKVQTVLQTILNIERNKNIALLLLYLAWIHNKKGKKGSLPLVGDQHRQPDTDSLFDCRLCDSVLERN